MVEDKYESMSCYSNTIISTWSSIMLPFHMDYCNIPDIILMLFEGREKNKHTILQVN